ncbi:hypothetical protein QE417_004527 [Mucilaginibacter terrae]|uniref:Uncharacterized protein n=1 Tax=Mucilaginibacter terrae TaxID=1955052 RepID=A0ABU3H3G9_9SPHI|nr:hypothetical protein [Mucilaginibacter terrae]
MMRSPGADIPREIYHLGSIQGKKDLFYFDWWKF